jgi:putative ABC transport system permease protein
MNTLLQDIRYALRMLAKSPGFAAIAILTLALGIGANTAIFSVIDAVLLRPLPFAHPERLVYVTGKFALGDTAGVSPPDYRDYRARNHTFEDLSVLSYYAGSSNLSGIARPVQVRSAVASWNLFDALGLRPIYGHSFVLADEHVEQPQVVILGNSIWHTQFGADPKIVGRTVILDGVSETVIGVLPSDPSLLSAADVWLPVPMLNKGVNQRLAHFLIGVGKMKPGVSVAQAQADIDAIAPAIDAPYPDTNKGWSLKLRPLAETLVGPVRSELLLVLGAVGLLLLIACANVASLLLARNAARRRELAIRKALGAPARRIVQQLLTESVLLGAAGGGVGLFVAAWGVAALRAFGPADLPRLNETHLSGVVFAFTAGLSLLTGILFGLAPALQLSRVPFAEVLHSAGRVGAQRARARLGSALVIGQIAVSLALLVGAGLLLKSFWRMVHVNPGFQPEHVVTASLSLAGPNYHDRAKSAAFYQQFETRVDALPGVQAAGAISELPLSGEPGDDEFYIVGRNYAPSQFDDAQSREVSPGYLAAMKIPLLDGRFFTWSDTATGPGVIVVDQAFASHYFPGKNAIGQRLKLVGDTFAEREIVGIIGSVNHDSLEEAPRPQMYTALAQSSYGKMVIVVRSAANVPATGAELQSVVTSLDKNEALSKVRTMDDVIGASVAQPRFSAMLVGLFAALAVVLAAVGLYGLIAYSVGQRTNEIGIRMALGAQRGDVLRLVLGQGARLAVAGVVIGVVASLGLTRLLASLLFGVSAYDPLTFAAMAVLLCVVALAACYIPARRAMKVDPMVALRYE